MCGEHHRYRNTKARTAYFKPDPLCITCTLPARPPLTAHCAELTFAGRASFAQAIEDFICWCFPRRSVVVNEVSGFRSSAAAGALRVQACASAGCRSFVRLASVVVPHAGANSACR